MIWTKKSQRWRVVNTIVPEKAWPENISSLISKHRLRVPPKAGLAALLDDQNIKRESSFKASLFSTLPLPLSISLPVHISASFILSSDRRNIRLDDYNNAESDYNRWLLNSVVPLAYLFLLEILAREGDEGYNDTWWPYSVHRDAIADVIIKSFYQTHLKVSNCRVFRSIYDRSRLLLPSEVVILGDEIPEVVSKLLKLTKPTIVVKLSSPAQFHAIKEGDITFVDRNFARHEILNASTEITPHLKVKEIHKLVMYLVEDDVQVLTGLPLLPLANGRFAIFELQSDAQKIFYIWTPSRPGSSLFDENRLVHPSFEIGEVLKRNFNVAPMSSKAVMLYLLEGPKIFPSEFQNFTRSPEIERWIQCFWDEYHTLNTPINELSTFPIIPTKRSGDYVSLDSCKRSVIITTRREEDWLWDCLDKLGITIVYRDQPPTPNPIQETLSVRTNFPDFQIENLLSSLEPRVHQDQFASMFTEQLSIIETRTRGEFLGWIRSKLAATPKSHTHIARKLPVWVGSQRQQLESHPHFLRAACDVIMLPPNIDLDARRFLDDFIAEYSYSLTKIGVEPLTIPQLRARLKLPDFLGSADQQPYKHVLNAIIDHFAYQQHRPSSLLVPNFNGVMMNSDMLYTRDPLFNAAFGNNSEQFLSETFRDLEPRLFLYGIQRQENLDGNMFFKCASAINNSNDHGGENQLERARVVSQIYAQDLPLHISTQNSYFWQRFDNLKFIPRRPSSSPLIRGLLDVSQYVRPSQGDIASPNQLVRTEFEPVAWTQRYSFEVQPHERITIAYPTLGVPTCEEVVR